MATLQWGTVGYVKYYFVNRSGGLKEDGSEDHEHRPCFTVEEVQAVIAAMKRTPSGCSKWRTCRSRHASRWREPVSSGRRSFALNGHRGHRSTVSGSVGSARATCGHPDLFRRSGRSTQPTPARCVAMIRPMTECNFATEVTLRLCHLSFSLPNRRGWVWR